MKILMIPSWYATEDRPDAGVFFREQAEALSERGHEVTVAYADLRFRLGGLKTGLYKAPGTAVDTYICRRRSLTPFWEDGRHPQRRRMLEKLYAAAAEEHGRPDVVHLHSCRMAQEAVALCRKHDLPLIYTEHYSGVLKKNGGSLGRELRAAMDGCDAAVAVSGKLRESMLPYGRGVSVVPNLVDTERFSPSHGIRRPGFVFGAMGNLVPVKGWDILIRAFARASSAMPDATLKIAGGGPEETELKALAGRLAMNDKIILTGPVPHSQAPEFFNSCDAVVCSSRAETFCTVLIEAMACGKPVVSTRCGGPEDFVSETNGILCGAEDPGALSEALLAMYRGCGSFDGARIRADCVRRFGRDAVCGQLEAVYQRAALGRGKDVSALP